MAERGTLKYLLSILLFTQLLFVQGWASVVRYDSAECSTGLQRLSEQNSIRAGKIVALAPSPFDYDSESEMALLTTEESSALTPFEASSGGPVEMAAEAIINGRTLHLKDIAVFPKGAEQLNIGMKEVLRLRGQLADEVAGMGFDTLRITGIRLTGANPGKAVDMTIDLTKRTAGQ